MKKIVKMSLVAAVAVAGLTTANAKPLEEAIKNVDVSGTVVYRYDDRSFKSTNEDTATGNRNDDVNSNNYKIGMNVKATVNDDVTAVTRFLVANHERGDAGFASLNNSEVGTGEADANPSVTLSNVYFSYTGIANTTINVGKQGLTTPWTVAEDADGNEQTGTGILALTTVGPVTLAGAYFNQTNLPTSGDESINGSKLLGAAVAADNTTSFGGTATNAVTRGLLQGQDNVMTAGVITNVGPVALDGWYLKMIDAFDTYTVGASAKFDLDAVKLSVGARHTVLEFDEGIGVDGMSEEKQKLTKIMLGLKAGIFGAKLNYGKTGTEGGLVALDNDATTGMQGWTVQLNGVADATYLQAGVDVQVLDSLNIALNYHKLDKDSIDNANDFVIREDGKEQEIYLQATYQMSKNFGGYIRFGQEKNENTYVDVDGDTEDSKGTIGRLQVQYSF